MMKLLLRDDVNFALTNRLPRRALTRAVGRISRSEAALVRGPAIALWRFFAAPDLSDARETKFRSLQHAFTRELREDARAFDPDPKVVASPCDAIVGACGRIEAGQLYQVKGHAYPLAELLHEDGAAFEGGVFATLRLTAGMYHRFHAPHDIHVSAVRHISGDVWNVNRSALKKVDKLYCRNERAVIRAELGGMKLLIVPVAAILVAGIRLHLAGGLLRGADEIACDAALLKGEEMGWFEHGSTIIVLAPTGVSLAPGIAEGVHVRAGEALMRL